MRITDKMVQRGLVDDIQRQMSAMGKLQEQISSGKRVHNLSDDPTRAARSVALNASENALVQNQRSAEDGISWMTATLASLAEARSTIQTARTTALQGSNDTQTDESREVLAVSVDKMLTQLVQAGNSKFNGYSLFGGNKTSVEAFNTSGVYQGDTGSMVRDIAPGETSVINLNGSEVFIGAEDAFQVLKDLKTALSNNSGSEVNNAIPRLDAVLNRMLKFEAQMGAEVKRVETTVDRLDDLQITLKERISENDDTDMTRALVELQNANNLYEASLKSASELFKTSLLNFLQ